jgi:hypothetical protein
MTRNIIRLGIDGLGGCYVQGQWPPTASLDPKLLPALADIGVRAHAPLSEPVVFDVDNGRGIYDVLGTDQGGRWRLQLRSSAIWWPFQRPERFNG